MLRHLYNHEKNIRNLPESETNRSFDTTNEVNRSSTIAVKIPIDRLLWCCVRFTKGFVPNGTLFPTYVSWSKVVYYKGNRVPFGTYTRSCVAVFSPSRNLLAACCFCSPPCNQSIQADHSSLISLHDSQLFQASGYSQSHMAQFNTDLFHLEFGESLTSQLTNILKENCIGDEFILLRVGEHFPTYLTCEGELYERVYVRTQQDNCCVSLTITAWVYISHRP